MQPTTRPELASAESPARARRLRSVLARPALREIVLYLGGEVGSRMLTFGALILLANLVAPAEFGLSSLYFGLANLAAILLALGLPNTVIRFFFEPIRFATVLGSIVVMIGAVAAMSLGLVPFVAEPVAAFLAVPVPLLLACLVGGTAIAVRSVWTASLRARRRSVAYASSLLIEPVVGVGLVLAWLAITRRVDHLTIAWSFAAAAVGTAIIAVLAWLRDPGLAWDRRVARELLVFSLPLIFHAFAMYALGTFDQIVINQTLGPDATGAYAFAYRWGMAMTALTAAFAAMWGPRFQELVRTDPGRARLDRLAWAGLGSLAAAGVVLMVALPIVARPFTPVVFEPALRLVPVVTYAYLWYALYTAVIGYAIYTKRTRRIAVASLAIVTVTIGLNYVVIPRFGIAVAALTSVLAYAALFAAQWWLVRDVAGDIRFGRLAAGTAALGAIPIATWFVL